jgi:hypothetical protein
MAPPRQLNPVSSPLPAALVGQVLTNHPRVQFLRHGGGELPQVAGHQVGQQPHHQAQHIRRAGRGPAKKRALYSANAAYSTRALSSP